jgi:hypothetical protein
MQSERKRFGWGFAKLEPLFLPSRERCLILDSDIVFAGPFLESLEACPGDFIVQHEDPTPDFVRSHYFDLESLRVLDPGFTFPGFTFNTGQLVATTGILNRDDFSPFVDWENPPKIRHPDVFKLGEQGLLNYILMSQQQSGAISLTRKRFMEVPGKGVFMDSSIEKGSGECVQLERIGTDSPYRFLIHWCGLKKPHIRDMICGDILLHFEREYYKVTRIGVGRKLWQSSAAQFEVMLRGLGRMMKLRILWRWIHSKRYLL